MDALNEAFELDGDADFFLYAYGFAEDANADAAFVFPAGPNAAAAAAAAFAAGPFGAGPFAAAAVPAGLVAGPLAAAAVPAGLVAGPFAAAAFPAGLVAGPFAAAIPAGHADGDADGDDEDDPNNPWKTVPRRRFRHVRGRTAPLPDPPASPVKICTNAIPWVPKRGNRRDVKKHAQAAKSGFAMSAEGPGHFVFGSFGPTSLEF